MSTRSGSMKAPLAPSSDSTRPQYGSSPLSEHCTSWLFATARAAVRASPSDRAPITRTRTNLVAPSASRCHLLRERAAHLDEARRRARVRRPPPARPFASTSTVSFVERQPSTERQSNVSATARASARPRSGGSTPASVVRTASIVAIAGESIAAPFAIPPTVAPPVRATASFASVSVVMIARAAAAPPSGASCPHSFGMPTSSTSIGIGMPMRPVEHTSTSSVARPRPWAVSSHMRAALRRPGSPVAALALPELSTTDAARPSRRCRCDTCTGAACARFVVKTPAADTDRAILGRDEREVGCARRLDAAGDAARHEPRRGHDAHGCTPSNGRPVVSGMPSRMLAACSIWPDAPLTRLSSAAMAITVAVRSS